MPGTQGLRFAGLRIAATCKHSCTGTPSSSTVTIYNLTATSVAAFQIPGAEVRVLAGYDIERLCFLGTVVRGGVKEVKQGPDRILTVELLDGGASLQAAFLSVSFASQTSLAQVFATVAAAINIPLGYVAPMATTLLPKGVVLVGPAREQLDKLAATLASRWFIRDGTLCFLPLGSVTPATVVEFSAQNGNLIGSPSPKAQGADVASAYPPSSIEVVGLLESSLRPGMPFAVASERISGQYTALDVTHEIDSGFDQPFYTRVTGAPTVNA